MAATALPHLDWATDPAQLAVVEYAGAASNPTILQWAKDAGFTDYRRDSTAWCALFVARALVAAGLPHTRSLAAQSYRLYGTRLRHPVPGAIFVMPRGNEAWMGHTGIVETVAKDRKTFTAINGNVSNAVKRTTYTTASCFADGFRWPGGLPMTAEARAAVHGGAPEPALGLGERLLQRGMTGVDVEAAQVILDRLGYMDNDPATAVFGGETQMAVMRFQRDRGLVDDGIIGEATGAALQKANDEKLAEAKAETTAKKAAKPAAQSAGAAGAAGGAIGATAIVTTATQAADGMRGLWDGTALGLVFVALALLVLGLGGVFAYRHFTRKAAREAVAD